MADKVLFFPFVPYDILDGFLTAQRQHVGWCPGSLQTMGKKGLPVLAYIFGQPNDLP